MERLREIDLEGQDSGMPETVTNHILSVYFACFNLNQGCVPDIPEKRS